MSKKDAITLPYIKSDPVRQNFIFWARRKGFDIDPKASCLIRMPNPDMSFSQLEKDQIEVFVRLLELSFRLQSHRDIHMHLDVDMISSRVMDFVVRSIKMTGWWVVADRSTSVMALRVFPIK